MSNSFPKTDRGRDAEARTEPPADHAKRVWQRQPASFGGRSATAGVIESAGFDVHHIVGDKDADRSRRKHRFWPDAPGVKGCTVHSFKGWETASLVLGIGNDDQSKRLAYVGMRRVKMSDGQPSHLSIVSLWIASFQSTFKHWQAPRIPMWPPPDASGPVT